MTRPLRLCVININPVATTRAGTRQIARALKRQAPMGSTVRERHFLRVAASGIPDVDAIVIGPQGVPFDAYPAHHREHLFTLLRALAEAAPPVSGAGPGAPVLGICGGHQALILAHGGTLAPVHGGTASGSYAGHQKETGLRRVLGTGMADALGACLPGSYVVSHVEGVSVLPDSFLLIGAGDPCRVHLARRVDRQVWGAQFHPERGGDGDAFLRRFLGLASPG